LAVLATAVRGLAGSTLGVVSSVPISTEGICMESTTCPRCGFVQDGGAECRRCGVIFARVRPADAAQARPPAPRSSAAAVPSSAVAATATEPRARPGTLRRIYRIFRWVALAASLTVLFLLLHKSRPPEVEVDAQALTRVEAKLGEMQEAAARGVAQPLELDEGELNGWLSRSLALAPPAGGSAAEASGPTVEEVRSNVRDVRVKLVEDRVLAWVLFDFHGKDLTLTLEGRLYAQDGLLRLDPTAAWLGSMPVPRAALQRAVARAFSDPRNVENLRLPPDVADVRVADGRLIVTPAVSGPSARTPARFYVPGDRPASASETPAEELQPGSSEPGDSSSSGAQPSERTDPE
jgi:hypothetical protein